MAGRGRHGTVSRLALHSGAKRERVKLGIISASAGQASEGLSLNAAALGPLAIANSPC